MAPDPDCFFPLRNRLNHTTPAPFVFEYVTLPTFLSGVQAAVLNRSMVNIEMSDRADPGLMIVVSGHVAYFRTRYTSPGHVGEKKTIRSGILTKASGRSLTTKAHPNIA